MKPPTTGHLAAALVAGWSLLAGLPMLIVGAPDPSMQLASGALWLLGVLAILAAARGLARHHPQAASDLAHWETEALKYRTIAEGSHDWEYWIAPDDSLRYVSPSCESLTGYRPQAFLDDPGLLVRIVHPGDRRAFLRHVARCRKRTFETTPPAQIDFRILTRQGEVRWISHHCVPIVDARTGYLGQRVNNRDITRRKAAENELRRATRLLEAIRSAQSLYLAENPRAHVFRELLDQLVAVTGSRCGALDEVHRGRQGDERQRLAIAAGQLETEPETRQATGQDAEHPMASPHASGPHASGPNASSPNASSLDRALDRLLGCVATARAVIILNDLPQEAPERNRNPNEPLPRCCLGLPIHFGTELVGTVALADRPEGYDEALATWLEPFVGAAGAIIHAMQLERDRREAEATLRKQASAMSALLSALPESAFLMERDGTLISANETLAQRLGHRLEEMIGGNLFTLLPEGLAESRRHHIAPVFQNGTPTRFRDQRNGRLIDHFIHPILDPQGRVERVAVFAADVTEHERALLALSQANQHHRALLEANLDPLVVIEADGHISDVNAATERATGLSRHRLIGTDFCRYFTNPQRARTGYRMAFEQGQVRDFELGLRHRDGHVTPVLYNASVYRDHAGAVSQVIAAARDITELKRVTNILEARLRLLHLGTESPRGRLLQGTLDEVCDLTSSPIGFFHCLDADQETLILQAWSTRTSREFCQAEASGLHYPISEAGVWVDCVRERRPVIHNDYASLSHRRGLPPGHAEVIRELVVPVFRAGRIVAILGVGNKPRDYDEGDTKLVCAFADLAWDVAEQKRASEALHESEARYRRIVETASEGIWAMDERQLTTFVNAQMGQMLGREPAELMGRPVSEHMFPEDIDDHRQEMASRQQGGHGHYERRFRRRDGSELWTLVSSVPILDDDGLFRGSFGMFTDITLLKDQQRRLEQMAHFDPLTGLPNRILLADRMRIALANAWRSERLLAVCFLDLDGFKPVNDRYGHAEGDRLLVAVAGRLGRCVREGDTVARLGGDEFALLLGGLQSAEECEQAISRIMEALTEPYRLEDAATIVVSASIGLTLYPLDHSDADTLLRHADQAMYRAKQAGRNCFRLFEAAAPSAGQP